MQLFDSQIKNLSEQIKALESQLESLEHQKSQLEFDEEEASLAFSKLSSLLRTHKDSPEIIECVRDRFDSLFSEIGRVDQNRIADDPQSEPQSEPEEGIEVELEEEEESTEASFDLQFNSEQEAYLFGRHAVERNLVDRFEYSSSGLISIFGIYNEDDFNQYIQEFGAASEDPIELEFSDRNAAESFSQDLIEKNLASEFEIDDDGKLTVLDPKEPEEILRLLETEPNPKNWISEQAYHRNDCLVIGFKTKKLRNEWEKFFDIPLGGNAKIEPMDSSLINGLKVSLKITFYSGIEKSLERIQEFDFLLTPEENESHIKQKSEEIGIQFSSEEVRKNVWMLYAKRPFEDKIQLAGALLLNGKYRVPNLNNRDFDSLDLAAEALWHHRDAS